VTATRSTRLATRAALALRFRAHGVETVDVQCFDSGSLGSAGAVARTSSKKRMPLTPHCSAIAHVSGVSRRHAFTEGAL